MEFRWVLGLGMALMLPVSAMAQNVSDKVDRFTGNRDISYVKDVGGNTKFGVPIPGFFVSRGEKDVSGIRFMISPELGRYASQSAQFIGCRNVDWLIDGKPVKFGAVVHDMRRYDQLLVEFVVQSATIEQIAQIGAASQVEFRICGKEGSLDSQDIAAARQVASLASGSAQSTAPSGEVPDDLNRQAPDSTGNTPTSAWRKWGGKGH